MTDLVTEDRKFEWTMGDLSQERLEEVAGSWATAIRFLPETGSTNSDALDWAARGAAAGSIVVADHQTAGRGRLGRSWYGRPGGGIHLSVVLRPSAAVDRIPLINLAAAVAVCRTLGEHGIEARVKWPNDVMVGAKKVCGILSEAQVDNDATVVVLGVGINVSLDVQDFPEEIVATATSLIRESGRDLDRAELIASFLRQLARLLPKVPGDASSVLEAYRPLCSTLGRAVRVDIGDRVLEGIAIDLDTSGALTLDTGEVIRAGDVVHLR